MKRSTILNTVRIAVTWLWRLALTLAVIAGLLVLAGCLVLNLVFHGPSQSAREDLALTLLEYPWTQDIPALFLGQDAVAQLQSPTLTGNSDPDLIQIDPDITFRATVLSSTTYSGQLFLFPANSGLQFTLDEDDAQGNRVILTSNVESVQCWACFLESGVLFLADETAVLTGLERNGATVGCGTVLYLNGQANEALYAGACAYAPRAAIGQAADGTVIFITTDGGTTEHPGATCQDIMDILSQFGAVNACLLDSDSAYSAWALDPTAESTGESEE